MSNPAELLIRGNPGKRRRGRRTTTKGTTMATRRRRRKSPSSIAKRRAKRATRKASRKGKMPPGLAAWHARNKGGKIARKARRSRRGKKSSAKRSRRRSRARRRRMTHALAIPRRARKARRSRSRGRGKRRAKARARRRVRSNAGEISLVGAFTGLGSGLKDVVKGGVGGIAAAVGGAGVAVVGGAFVSRLTNGLLFRFAPGLASNPMVARGVGALNFLLPGYAVAKWMPGISGRVRRGVLTGAAVAAIIEAIKPGAVRDTLASIPVIGGVFGPSLSGMADAMGDYLAFGMSGASSRDGGAALMYDENAAAMSDYVASMRNDMDRTMRADGGMSDYAMFGDE